jgi:hypothetical protein
VESGRRFPCDVFQRVFIVPFPSAGKKLAIDGKMCQKCVFVLFVLCQFDGGFKRNTLRGEKVGEFVISGGFKRSFLLCRFWGGLMKSGARFEGKRKRFDKFLGHFQSHRYGEARLWQQTTLRPLSAVPKTTNCSQIHITHQHLIFIVLNKHRVYSVY